MSRARSLYATPNPPRALASLAGLALTWGLAACSNETHTTAGGSSGAHLGKWKVMMLGDSITASTCYPQYVYQGLMAAGHTNFQFVGTQTNNQSCNAMQVVDEGHGGYGVTYLPHDSTRGACSKSTGCGSYAELQSWAAEKPDIVLVHYGTNDVWDGIATGDILSAYVAVIAEIRKQNPNVAFLVSKIIKMHPSGCDACPTRVSDLASALTDSWASTNSTQASPVSVVDDYDSAFNPDDKTDTPDGVHPTPAGAKKMALATTNAVIATRYF